MAFRDQMNNLVGKDVRVETTNGTISGRLSEVKSSTIILREDGSRRTIIRISKIIAVREDHHSNC